MGAVSRLLGHSLVYDVVVSDFGREATIEYLRVLAEVERNMIISLLAEDGPRPFFDEYRRIMLTVVADVAYCKRNLIKEVVKENGFLTRGVLVGDDSSLVPGNLLDRVTRLVAQEALVAFDRGYRQIRLVIPCNALSGLAVRIHHNLRSPEVLERLSSGDAPTIHGARRLLDARLSVHTVVDAVLAHVARTAPGSSLLLLGLGGTQELYRHNSLRFGLEVVEVTASEQKLINDTIIAAIGGDVADIQRLREGLVSRVVEPRRLENGRITVVEACTDLSLKLGLNSTRIFADELVRSWYGDLVVGDEGGHRVS